MYYGKGLTLFLIFMRRGHYRTYFTNEDGELISPLQQYFISTISDPQVCITSINFVS